MKKLLITIIFMVISIVAFYPLKANALSLNSNVITSVQDNTSIASKSDHEYILGDPDDEDSVAWLVQKILNYIKILGPILVVLLSSIDFIMVIVKSDNEAMAKAQKKLIMRLILAVLLFLIPTLVQAILDIFGITSSTAGLQ